MSDTTDPRPANQPTPDPGHDTDGAAPTPAAGALPDAVADCPPTYPPETAPSSKMGSPPTSSENSYLLDGKIRLRHRSGGKGSGPPSPEEKRRRERAVRAWLDVPWKIRSTVDELAQELGVSSMTIRNYIRRVRGLGTKTAKIVHVAISKAAGKSNREVAQEMGLPTSQVNAIVSQEAFDECIKAARAELKDLIPVAKAAVKQACRDGDGRLGWDVLGGLGVTPQAQAEMEAKKNSGGANITIVIPNFPNPTPLPQPMKPEFIDAETVTTED